MEKENKSFSESYFEFLKENGNTHIVIKIEDIQKYLSEKEQAEFICQVEQIAHSRIGEGKSLNSYLIVNHDEPYSGEVESIIARHEEI